MSVGEVGRSFRWVVGLLGGSRSEGRSNCTVGVDGLVYGVRTCTGKAGVWGLGDELCEGLVSASFVEWDRQEWVSSRYCHADVVLLGLLLDLSEPLDKLAIRSLSASMRMLSFLISAGELSTLESFSIPTKPAWL
jgi:hypothetical protein